MEIEDTRFLIIDFSNANPKPSDLRVGDGLDVTATADKEGNFHATSIQSNRDIAQTINERDGIEVQREREGRTGPPPTIMVRPDSSSAGDNDSGPPVLKHGKPAPHASDPIPDDAPVTTATPLADTAGP